MSTEQHLIENALFHYRKYGNMDFGSDPLIEDQMKSCDVSLNVMQEFVEYVYYNVFETEDERIGFFHDNGQSPLNVS